MPSPLLATKTNFPAQRPNLFVRPRLIEQLDRCLMVKFAILSAPAGFGKTTLLRGWLDQ